MFDIKVKQIESPEELDDAIENSEKLVVCAGRWGPMCIPVYVAMEQLDQDVKYNDIRFRVINFDTEPAAKIRNLKECKSFRGLPFTVYYYNGQVMHATSSIQTRKQLHKNIKKYFK